MEPIKFHDKNNHIHLPNFKGRLILTNHYSPKSEIHETTLETMEYSLFLREKYPQLTILHQCSSLKISLKKFLIDRALNQTRPSSDLLCLLHLVYRMTKPKAYKLLTSIRLHRHFPHIFFLLLVLVYLFCNICVANK